MKNKRKSYTEKEAEYKKTLRYLLCYYPVNFCSLKIHCRVLNLNPLPLLNQMLQMLQQTILSYRITAFISIKNQKIQYRYY